MNVGPTKKYITPFLEYFVYSNTKRHVDIFHYLNNLFKYLKLVAMTIHKILS